MTRCSPRRRHAKSDVLFHVLTTDSWTDEVTARDAHRQDRRSPRRRPELARVAKVVPYEGVPFLLARRRGAGDRARCLRTASSSVAGAAADARVRAGERVPPVGVAAPVVVVPAVGRCGGRGRRDGAHRGGNVHGNGDGHPGRDHDRSHAAHAPAAGATNRLTPRNRDRCLATRCSGQLISLSLLYTASIISSITLTMTAPTSSNLDANGCPV